MKSLNEIESWLAGEDLAIERGLDENSSKKAIHGALMDLGMNITPTGQFIKPKVEGGYAFHRAWSVMERHFEDTIDWVNYGDMSKAEVMGGIFGMCYTGLQVLQEARVITIHPDQADVIPPLGSEGALDYALNAQLPFDTIFLDIATPTRTSVFKSREGTDYHIAGAVIGRVGNGISVMPLGLAVDAVEADDELNYIPFGVVTFDEEYRGGPALEVIEDKELFNVRFKEVRMNGGYLAAIVNHIDPEARDSLQEWPDFGESLQKLPVDIIVRPPSKSTQDNRSTAAIAAGLCLLAERFLDLMFFLDTPNVELEDVKMSRQVRRAIERSDEDVQISQTVWVKHNNKRYTYDDDHEPQNAHFSHQFEVRGHWKFYPEHTRAARARPDLLRYVPGRGMCRKVWCQIGRAHV